MAAETLRSACPLDCPDACSLHVAVEGGRVVGVGGAPEDPLTAGFICAKVRRFPEHMYGPDRVLQPSVRDGAKGSGRFRPVSWDEALDRVAGALADARDRFGGASILPFCYGGSNGYLSQDATDARLFRRLGSSRLLRTVCAAPTGAAAAGLYGKMPGVALPDYEHARLIVMWGCNPTASGIHLGPPIQRAQQRGARLVVVDPRRTRLARQADLHIALRPGTDLPVALSLIAWLFESGRADLDFLAAAAHATGVEALRERARAWTFARAAKEAGVSAGDLEAFARLYADTSPAVIRCGWGPERNRNAGSSVAAILALPAVAGKFGVRGGGYTMSNSPAWRDIDSRAAAAEPEQATRAVNMNRLGAALTELDGPPIKALFVYNANPVATIPNQEKVRAGLLREDLFTVVFDAVWTDSARFADVVLPATTFLEHDELARGYGGYVLHAVRPVAAPVGEARPNHAVFGALVRRLGLARDGDPEGAEALVDALLASTPDGGRLRRDLARDGRAVPAFGATPIQFVDVFPHTADGKIDLCPAALEREAPGGLYGYRPDPATAEAPLALISPASSHTVSSTFGQLVAGPVAIELAPEDARRRGIADGDRVRVWNALGEVRCRAAINPDLRDGVAMLPKGLWARHTDNGATANALCPDTLTDFGGGACFNDARVEIQKIA